MRVNQPSILADGNLQTISHLLCSVSYRLKERPSVLMNGLEVYTIMSALLVIKICLKPEKMDLC